MPKRKLSSGKRAPKARVDTPTVHGAGDNDLHCVVQDPLDMLDEGLEGGQMEFLARLNPYV